MNYSGGGLSYKYMSMNEIFLKYISLFLIRCFSIVTFSFNFFSLSDFFFLNTNHSLHAKYSVLKIPLTYFQFIPQSETQCKGVTCMLG